MLFSLFDIKSKMFGQIFECATPEEAKRLLVSVIKSRKDPVITEYPEDFNLVLFPYDNLTTLLLSLNNSEVICSAQECHKLAFSIQSMPIVSSDTPIDLNDLMEKGSILPQEDEVIANES